MVSNSGPLIALATVSKLHLLKDLFGQIYIPPAVYDEVVVYGEGKPGARETGAAEWIKTVQVEDRLAVNLLRGEVDTAANIITATPNHFSLWAVLGETRRVFLPVTLRNH